MSYQPRKITPMTPEVRARLDARAATEKWWGRWTKFWAKVGIEQIRQFARDRITDPMLGVVNTQAHPWMFEAALRDYKLRFPTARGVHHYTTELRRDGFGPALMEFKCRYCGDKLGVTGGYGIPRGADIHTGYCALRSLAGLMTPVPPGYVKPTLTAEDYKAAVTKLSEITKVIVLAWASNVVDDTMLRFSQLELD